MVDMDVADMQWNSGVIQFLDSLSEWRQTSGRNIAVIAFLFGTFSH